MRALSQVMWLGLTVAVSASAATLTTPRQAEVQAVSVIAFDGGVSAHTTPVTVRIAPNRTRTPSVGVTEAFAGGGGQWLTTLWQAALVATQTTQRSLHDYEFSLRVAGRIDGPSAGLLTTSTLVALIRGKRPLPKTTMTGSVNPDGSSGPVAGVLPALRGAARDGVKRFGFALGGRQQVDATGEVVDLLVEGKRLGVQVKEVGSLDEAYLFLTGEVLPRPDAASESDMDLWPVELAALTRLTAKVRRDVEAELPAFEAALGPNDPQSTAWKGIVERSMKEATDLTRNGDTVRAMVVWSSILTATRVATQDAQLLRSLDARDLQATFVQLEAQETAHAAERLNLRRQIDAQFPNTTRANDIYALDLLESVVSQGRALRAAVAAKELLALAKEAQGAALTDEKYQAFRRQARRHAEDVLRLREELGNGQRFLELYASLPRMKKSMRAIDATGLATSYAAAGAASRAYFEALLATPTEQAPVRAFIEKDDAYLDLVGYGELLTSEPDGRARLLLASRQAIYSAYLVNTYSALGGQFDAKGVFSIRNARALSAQLDLARLRVLQSCGRAKRETGSIPFPARMRFLNARVAREGTDRQKADTLAELWISDWWCDLAVRDAR